MDDHPDKKCGRELTIITNTTPPSLPLPPVAPPLVSSSSPLPLLASVHDPAVQAHWFTTLDQMSLSPAFDSQELKFVRSSIQHGIELPLIQHPPDVSYDNTYSVTQHIDAVRDRLRDYIQWGAVEVLPPEVDLSTVNIQPLHVIIKPNKKPRLVIDLSRNLNQYIEKQHFKYSTVDQAVELSTPGCWYGKLDLSNCFLSFPLHPKAKNYFIFRLDGVLYRFIRMPFGLTCAPRYCTQLLSVVAYELTRHDCVFVRYLDDFLFIAATQQDCQRMLDVAIATFTRFGLVVNPDKTEGPLQSITFLGVEINSVTSTLACTPDRLRELLSLLTDLVHTQVIRRRNLQSVVGKLSFAAQVLPGARPFMRRILDKLNGSTSIVGRIRVGPSFKADVAYWLTNLGRWNGREMWRQPASVTIATDASLKGFGFYLEQLPSHICCSSLPLHLQPGSGFSGTYSDVHSEFHALPRDMVWCELFSVLAAAHVYARMLAGQSVLFRVDNQPDVAIINRQATRSARLALLLRSLYDLALQYNFSVTAVHRPGVDNVVADYLSRPELHNGEHIANWKRTDLFVLHSVSVLYSRQVQLHELTQPRSTPLSTFSIH